MALFPRCRFLDAPLVSVIFTCGFLVSTFSLAHCLSFNGFKHYRLVPLTPRAVERVHWLERAFPPEPNPHAGFTFLTSPGRRSERAELLVPPSLEEAFLAVVRATPSLRVRLLHGNYGRLIAQFNRENERSRNAAGEEENPTPNSDTIGHDGIQLARARRQSGYYWPPAPPAPPQQQRLQPQPPHEEAAAPLKSGLLLRHNYYRSFSEIRRSLVQLNDRCNALLPGTCELLTIGTSFEKRELLVLKISKNSTTSSSSRRRTKLWLDGGIHAREWVSPATALNLADWLVASLSLNATDAASQAAEIVNQHEVYILPLYNPDGYEYSRVHNRMWRKSRQLNRRRRQCRGVDLNRNYGYRWGRDPSRGSSGNPCENNYRGEAPFSAPETDAVRRFLGEEPQKNSLLMFLSLHTYGQFLLIPYGYRRHTYSRTHDQKMRCAAHMAIYKMLSINNRFYTFGTGSDLLYEANGGSDDWAHGSAGIPYSYTVELPDEGDYGFLLPARGVPDIARETLAGLQALLHAARSLEANDTSTMADCRGLQG